MNNMGRPTLYTPELGDEICGYVMEGMSLSKICRLDHMPVPATVYRWFRLHKDFCDNYAKAKEDQADYFVEDILEIADAAKAEDVAVARLRVDTRKWAASKYKPKKYGDRIIQQGDKDADPIQIEHKLSDILAEIDGKTSGLPPALNNDKLLS